MDWGTLGAIAAIVSLQTEVLLWMMSKLDSDIRSIANDSNAKWMAVNSRIDTTQSIIMRMLEKQGR